MLSRADGPVPLLEVRNLSVSFRTEAGLLNVTRDVSFSVAPGETVGIVGESGSGKSVTGLALLQLLPERTAVLSGEVLFEGRNLLDLTQAQMRQVRGRRIAMIFQEPMSALDPVFTVGQQICEGVRRHFGISRKEARERAIEMLTSVGIPLPRQRVDEYPHQLSGGMRQRAMIAIALACEPSVLIADEPTTALDVTIQAQIIDLLDEISSRTKTAVIFISHDLGVIAETCSRVLTMYAGEVVEEAAVDEVLMHPRHPYTSGLLRSLPQLSERKAVLPSIPGRVPHADEMPAGCRFTPRCGFARPPCSQRQIFEFTSEGGVRCCRHAELHLPGAVA